MSIMKRIIIKFRMTDTIFDWRREKREEKKATHGTTCSTTTITGYPNRKKTLQ
jgi:hypothetical protein